MSEDWREARLPTLARPGLRVLFVGVNPGRASARTGHHFAGPQNAFWRLLHESGLTPRLFTPAEDALLPEFGIGITNIVARPSPGEDDLRPAELAAGADALRLLVGEMRPRVVALLGKRVAAAYGGMRPGAVAWGPLALKCGSGAPLAMALPNPSSRSLVPYAVRLEAFRAAMRAAGMPEA